MRHYFHCFLILLIILTGLNVRAQILPKSSIGMPDIYQFPVPGSDAVSNYNYLNRYWEVYSDRDNNYTYATPGGSTIKSKLSFMDKFRVAEVNGQYVHIYREVVNQEWPAISPTALSYGWIHKSHLLLWYHCLRNQKDQIDKKAMILNTFEGITNAAAEDQIVVYKRDPDLQISSEKKSRLFEILFIYKQTDKAVLLGQDIAVKGKDADINSNIRGWVPIDNVTFWDHRITLEPNWETAASDERKAKGIKPAIFLDEKAANDYRMGKPVESKYVIWENDPGNKRNIGQWRRFPIIEQRASNIYRTGVMGKIRTSSGMVIDEEKMAAIRKGWEDLSRKTSSINIVFVVDGTESMGKFYKSIAQGIEKSVSQLDLEDTQNRLKFGAVIYRDFLEKENKIEIRALTENHKEIINFFNGAKTDYSNDNDIPEAMYYGLKTALTKVGMRKEESNFIILIGDAGNHSRNDETQVDENEITDLMAQNECSLISFQVNNGSHPSYADFMDQSRRIIKVSAVKDREIRKATKTIWGNEIWAPEDPFFVSTGPTRYTLNPQEVIGSFLFPGLGQTLPFAVLENEIILKIAEFDKRVSEILAKANEILRGVDQVTEETGETDEYQPAVIDLLSKLQNLSDNDIRMLRKINYQFSMKGYTSPKVEGMRYPLFKEVLFLSREDLLETISRLNSLCEMGGSMSVRRQKMQMVWVEILESMLGSNNREEIMSMTVDDLSKVVFGLPSQSEFIGKVRLRDITEPTVISDTKFETYFDYMSNKLTFLKECVNTSYPESFISNNILYYWIPMEMFP